jgi:hypothetical protein
MCLIQYINTANLSNFTSENFAVKNFTLGKYAHMGRNTVFRLEYYHAPPAYQYKYALADWCFSGLGES